MGLSVVTVNKPIAGVTSSEVPADLAEFLSIEVPKALAANGGKDKELVLAHDAKALAEKYALYARAWGMRDDGALAQTELHETDEDGKEILVDGKPVIARQAIGYQVEIRRIPPRRDMPDNQIRLAVKKYDPDARRPGRPANTFNTPAPGPVTPTPATTTPKK